MIGELALRFVFGGVIVAIFSTIGELFKPKTFSGIFGAAPSVALATLTMAAVQHGRQEVARQTHAMLFGSVALIVYGAVLSFIVRRYHLPAWLEAGLVWALWLLVAALAWLVFSRR